MVDKSSARAKPVTISANRAPPGPPSAVSHSRWWRLRCAPPTVPVTRLGSSIVAIRSSPSTSLDKIYNPDSCTQATCPGGVDQRRRGDGEGAAGGRPAATPELA
jgi:hypothetical protein